LSSRGSGELPTELTLQLKNLMGDRLKTMIGTTYEIFDNKIANVFNKFTPAKDVVDKVKIYLLGMLQKWKTNIRFRSAINSR
jgi:hypothetical protein